VGSLPNPPSNQLRSISSHPQISINPLRDRIAECFEFKQHEDLSISFQDFMVQLASFNGMGRTEQKLKLAFRLQDFDGDGKISKKDLVRYLQAVSATSEGTTIDYETVASEILKEASTDEDQRFITYENFQRVVAPTEFENKMRIPI
jgi:Ca2+-binding EF-hand superfamily protein